MRTAAWCCCKPLTNNGLTFFACRNRGASRSCCGHTRCALTLFRVIWLMFCPAPCRCTCLFVLCICMSVCLYVCTWMRHVYISVHKQWSCTQTCAVTLKSICFFKYLNPQTVYAYVCPVHIVGHIGVYMRVFVNIHSAASFFVWTKRFTYKTLRSRDCTSSDTPFRNWLIHPMLYSYVPVCLSVFLSVCLSVCLSVSINTYMQPRYTYEGTRTLAHMHAHIHVHMRRMIPQDWWT